MRTNNKVQKINLAIVRMDFDLNPREPGREYLLDTTLQASLTENGQETPIWVEKKLSGEEIVFYVLRGHRRFVNMDELGRRGVIDPKTATLNEAGEIVGGKPFSVIDAIVYEDLTDHERYFLMNDHADMKGLSPYEAVRAIWQGFDAKIKEPDLIIRQAALLNRYFPTKKAYADPSKDGGKELKGAYHGTMQTFKDAWEVPSFVKDEYIRRLKGEKSYLTDNRLSGLASVFRQEVKAEPYTYSRENPGPKFMEEWARFCHAAAEAAVTGRKPKGTGMLSRSDIETHLRKVLSSRMSHLLIGVILNDIPSQAYLTVDELLVGIEKAMTPEQKAVLDKCAASRKVANLPATPTADTATASTDTGSEAEKAATLQVA